MHSIFIQNINFMYLIHAYLILATFNGMSERISKEKYLDLSKAKVNAFQFLFTSLIGQHFATISLNVL